MEINPKILCYIGFISMVVISIQLRNLPAGVFSMVMLMWFHSQNIQEEREKRRYKQFMSLK